LAGQDPETVRVDVPGLRSWPLLSAGLAILSLDVALIVSDGDQAIAAGVMLGIGSVMTGAGIANVLRHSAPPEPDRSNPEHSGD
jgi:hypothetical protein